MAKKSTPPTKKQPTQPSTPPLMVKSKRSKLRFGRKKYDAAPVFKPTIPTNPPKPKQRLRLLTTSRAAHSTIPKSFRIFKQVEFANDHIARALEDFCSCPAYTRLVPILHLEIKAWHSFSQQHSSIYGRTTYFQRQINQKSTDREPFGFCKDFLPHSFICRLLYRITRYPPKYYRSDEKPDFGTLFTTLRKLPHFSRNLTHEIITFCSLGHSNYITARQAHRKLGNSGWKTYQSALNQLAKHFNISFETLYHQLLQVPSPISDDEIANFCLHSADSKRWINNRSVAIICGLKKIAQTNNSTRFDTPFWSTCLSEVKRSGVTKRSSNKGLIFEKNFPVEFGYQIWLQARARGTDREAAQIQFINLTCQRPIDYDNFLPSHGELVPTKKIFRATWKWGKTREHLAPLQFTIIPYGRTDSFYDIKTCWTTLISTFPSEGNTYLFNFKNRYGKKITLLQTVKKFAIFVPLKFQPFPAQNISLYFFKNMMTDFLARTHDLHPQIGGHYLKHAIKDPDFVKKTKARLGTKAHMWFEHITLRYTLKVSHLPKIQKEFQRLWDEISLEQTQLINSLWKKMGLAPELLEKMKQKSTAGAHDKEIKRHTPGDLQ